MYETIQIHKPNFPLHPIISQIPTPVHQLTKIIKHTYLVNTVSTHKLIQILKIKILIMELQPHIESLFTNVQLEK